MMQGRGDRRRVFGSRAAPLLVLILTGGCGTTLNLSSPRPEVYGGTTLFLPSGEGLAGGAEAVFFLVFFPFIIADLPLSFAADTLTLPYTFFLNFPASDGPRAPAITPRCRAIESQIERHGICNRLTAEDAAFCERHSALTEELRLLRELREAEDVPELIAALRHPEYSLRFVALERLAIVGPKARAALPAILGQAHELAGLPGFDAPMSFRDRAALTTRLVAGSSFPELVRSALTPPAALNALFFLARPKQPRTADLRESALRELGRLEDLRDEERTPAKPEPR